MIEDYKKHSKLQAEVAKQKLRYFEEERAMQEKQKERIDLVEWQQFQANIRMLRNDLMVVGLRDEDKEYIEQDFALLVKKKNKLSRELGLLDKS